jgi:hypothetical protein
LILTAVIALAVSHAGQTTTGTHLELWQVINLVGAPVLAVLFARPVIDDIRAWLDSDRD